MSAPAGAPDPRARHVPDDRALAAAAERWAAASWLAVDTEFERTRTYFPRPGLYQVGDGDGVWLVDPLAVRDLGPLRAMLEDRGVTKVMHACGEDLELLGHSVGASVSGVFDTQIAAAFAGLGTQIGYPALVQTLLGIEVEKDQARSDWLARPLSAAQVRYAVDDVMHLPALHRTLEQRLEADGRRGWALEDMDALVDSRLSGPDPAEAHARVRGAQRVAPPRRAALGALAAWREREARDRDRPRRHVVPDEALVEILDTWPASERDLEAVRSLSPRARRRHGAAIVAAVASAPPEAGAARPTPTPPRVMRRLKAAVRVRAGALGIAPEILASTRMVEELAAAPPNAGASPPALLRGWRRDAVGLELSGFLDEEADGADTGR